MPANSRASKEKKFVWVRKSWRMLQSKAGTENVDYLAQ